MFERNTLLNQGALGVSFPLAYLSMA